MAKSVYHKIGDTLEPLSLTLEDANGDPDPIPGGASVVFVMREMGKGGAPKVSAPCTIVDANLAQVQYQWAAADVDTRGVFIAEVKVVSSGNERRHPSQGFLKIHMVGNADA